MSDKLNGKQKAFVEAYLRNGGNATQAALAAGYSEKTAYAQGCRLLKHVEIKNRLAKRAEKRSEAEMSLTDRIMLERKRLAFFDPKKLFHGDGTPKAVHELDDDTAAAIAGLGVANIGNSEVGIGQVLKLKMADKNASLTALEKINGMYRDKDESEGVLNIIINMS